jgi:uncharacterized membrane protein YfcA
MNLVLVGLGVMAGILTTLAGQGGGLFLLIACSLLMGPHAALAVTAPALLLGNLHRAILFRHAVSRPIAGRLILGAVPGALAGGLLAGAMPAWGLQVLLVGLTALSIARALRWVSFGVPRWGLAPAGLVVGAMTGTAGGAGMLIAPITLSSGLSGLAYIGTVSTVAFTMHLGRVVAYASNGLLTRDLVVPTLAVALAITAGNALGERVRRRLTDRFTTRLEYGVLVVCVGVSLAGLA